MADAQSTKSDDTPTAEQMRPPSDTSSCDVQPSPEHTQPPNLNKSETSGPPPPLPGNEAAAAEVTEDGPGQEPKPGTSRSENERFGTRTPPPPLPNADLVGNGVDQPAGPENDGPFQEVNSDTDEECEACTARISRCEQYELDVVKLQLDAKELKKLKRKAAKINKKLNALLKDFEESKKNAKRGPDAEEQ